MCRSESSTLPLPREPLTEREKLLERRLMDALAIAESATDGPGVDRAVRKLAVFGFYGAIGATRAEREHQVVYLTGVACALRRTLNWLDRMPQGTA